MSDLLHANPLVTVLIATRNRPEELRQTLELMRRQQYGPIEMIIVDDASTIPLEPLVRECWPGARYYRGSECTGQCQRRNEGFELAGGKYIIHIDDDSCFTKERDLEKAVAVMEERPEVGILSLFTYNGPVLPANMTSTGEARYAHSFLGASAVIRTSAIREVGGYLSFLQNHWEEDELSLRVLKAGWGILFYPGVVVHHRITPTNRRNSRTWMRGVRNQLWAISMHFPLRRVPVELGWKLTMACRDAIVYGLPHRLAEALLRFLAGLPRALSLRKAMDARAMRVYDALRFKSLRNADELLHPPACGVADLWKWFRTTWWTRPRSRPIWDQRKGDMGHSTYGIYPHNSSPPDA